MILHNTNYQQQKTPSHEKRGQSLQKGEIMNNSMLSSHVKPVNQLVEALAKAQLEIKAPRKDKVNPAFKSTANPSGSPYASLDSIYEAIREPLAKHGLVISHSVNTIGNAHSLITTLRHTSGDWIECSVPMFIEKLSSQGFASALTYSRRYAVCSILSLPADEDDDGNAATAEESGKGRKLNAPEISQIQSIIGDDQGLLANVLKIHNVSSLSELVGDFNFIIKNLKAAKGIK